MCSTWSASFFGVSKNVARLESALGVRLFHRSTRRLALTERGERLLQQVNAPASMPSRKATRQYASRGESDQGMTSSADISIERGITRPSALAAFWLITSSNVVGCSTGSSAGLVPLRMRSTYSAARRKTGR